MNKKFFLKSVIDSVAEEKSFDKETILRVLEQAVLGALNKKFNFLNLQFFIDRSYYSLNAIISYSIKKDIRYKTSLKDSFNYIYESSLPSKGKIYKRFFKMPSFKRIEINVAREILVNKFRILEKSSLSNVFSSFIGKTMTGIIKSIFDSYIIVWFDKNVEGFLNRSECMLGEVININKCIKVYVKNIIHYKGEQLLYLTRLSDVILIDLLKLEIPEIASRLIEIKSLIRIPGVQSKVVIQTNSNVKSVNVCLGKNGMRIKNVSDYLCGEKIDFVLWDKNIVNYILNMFPDSIIDLIELDYKRRQANVFARDKYISKMIGLKGRNINLLRNLTIWKIKILNFI